eukprot:1917461-Pyramimonas_sp.AAC.1
MCSFCQSIVPRAKLIAAASSVCPAALAARSSPGSPPSGAVVPGPTSRFRGDGIAPVVGRYEVGGVLLHPSHSIQEWKKFGLKVCAVCGFTAAVSGRQLSKPCTLPLVNGVPRPSRNG